MINASEKANKLAENVVDFSHRHSMAKLPCLAAVSLIYSADYIRGKLCELFERIKSESERPLGMRICAGMVSCAFVFMALPISGISAEAAALKTENTDIPSETEENYLPLPAVKGNALNIFNDEAHMIKENPDGTVSTKAEDNPALNDDYTVSDDEDMDINAAIDDILAMKNGDVIPEETDSNVLLRVEGLAEQNSDYSIELSAGKLKSEVTARFSGGKRYYNTVTDSFAYYNIPTDDLNIFPVDVTLYRTEERVKLNLKKGSSARLTFPLPADMEGHDEDLKVVRIEKNGTMTILEGELSKGNNGSTISFDTEHFSVFALVAYKSPMYEENIESGAPMTTSGDMMSFSMSSSVNVFAEDKRRFRNNEKKRKIYRIKRIFKESDKLL